VDASAAALAVARGNAARLGIANVGFRHGSWYAPVAGARFDLVVANPPYLAADDSALAALASEPRAALVSGPTGFEALESVCAGAPAALAAGGTLLCEHGAAQGIAVRARMAHAGFMGVTTHRDLAGCERVTGGRIPGATLQSASGQEE
jgi:release factor glutamine methyltransferase